MIRENNNTASVMNPIKDPNKGSGSYFLCWILEVSDPMWLISSQVAKARLGNYFINQLFFLCKHLPGDSHVYVRIWTLDKSLLFLFPNLSIGSRSVAYNSNRAKRLSLHCLLQSLRCCSSTPTIGGMKGNNPNYKNILTKYLLLAAIWH